MKPFFEDPLRELGPANRSKIYAELRERAPVYWSSAHVAWVLTRYADVNTVLRHPSSQPLDGLSFLQSISRRGQLDLSSLIDSFAAISLFTRGTRHELIRRMLAQAVSEIWRLNLPELLEQRAEQLLVSGECNGAIDLASGYGKALALFVIGNFLGVPDDDLQDLSVLAGDLVALMERTIHPVSTLIRLNKRAEAMTEYFLRLIRLKRKSGAQDGMSLLVRLADEQLACSDQELAGYCIFFFIAAEETTASAISGAALILLENSGLRTQLSNNNSLVTRAVRELLRLVSPVQFVVRQLQVDIRIEDQTIPAGEPIMNMLGAANRDPSAFPNPDEPELDRSGPEPLVFAAGPYRCIGVQLATLEVEVALRSLLGKPMLQLSSQLPVWASRVNIAPLNRLQAYFVK